MIPVSWLAKWEYCPMQLYVEHIKGISIKPNAKMIRGSVLHKVLAGVYKGDWKILSSTGPNLDLNGFIQLFRCRYFDVAVSAISSSKSELKQARLDMVETFESFLEILNRLALARAREAFTFSQTFNLHGEKLFEHFFPKFQASVFVESAKLRLKGEIDVVENYPEKVPVEFKLSTPPKDGAWDSHRIQLAAYMMLLKEESDISKGFIGYVKHGVRVPVVLNPFLEESVLKIRDQIEKMFETKEPPVEQSKNRNCGDCSYRDYCSRLAQTLNMNSILGGLTKGGLNG